jgi:hypothetical protein
MAKMSTQDILAKSLARSGQDPKKVHGAMSHLVQTDPKFRVMRSGNTLFSYYNKGNGVADVAMDTAATPQELVKDVKEFAKAMKVAKFHQGRFHMANPQIERVLKMAGLQYKLQPMPGGQMSVVVEV